jgi:hypothetical protein
LLRIEPNPDDRTPSLWVSIGVSFARMGIVTLFAFGIVLLSSFILNCPTGFVHH